jgi:hypothetical protein
VVKVKEQNKLTKFYEDQHISSNIKARWQNQNNESIIKMNKIAKIKPDTNLKNDR